MLFVLLSWLVLAKRFLRQDLKAASGKKTILYDSGCTSVTIPSSAPCAPCPNQSCKLNGIAAGAGCSLALACDIIVASGRCQFDRSVHQHWLVSDSGSSYFCCLTHRHGQSLWTCSMVLSESSRSFGNLGWWIKVVPAAQLDEAVKVYTDYFAQAPTKSIGFIKNAEQIRHQHARWNVGLRSLGTTNCRHQRWLLGGREGFSEKRKPEFKGK